MSSSNGDAFTKPDGFDLDAWISGAHLPERTVTLCGRPDLVADHEVAEQALRDARSVDHADPRLNQLPPGYELAEQVRALEEQIRASMRTFRVRSLSSSEIKTVDEESAKTATGVDETDHNDRWIAAASVSPRMTVEQVRALRAAVGEAEFTGLVKACMAAQSQKVTVPTSLAASSVLAQRDS